MNSFELLFPFEFQKDAASGDLRLFGGIASSTAIDRDTERMDKAVLPKIADGLRKNSTVFFNHDTKGLGVGVVKSAEVRGEQVYIDVAPTRAPGMQDVVMQIKEGVLKSFSVGGKVLDYENKFDEKLGKNVRIIKDVEIYEVSVVGVPANPEASIMDCIAKSFVSNKKEEAGEMNTETEKNAGTAPGVGASSTSPTPTPGPGTDLKTASPQTPAHEGGETPAQEQAEHGNKPTGILDKNFLKCGKCSKIMDKCAHCGEPFPAGAPRTHGDLESMTLSAKTEFEGMIKKAVDEMDSKVKARSEEMEKSYKEREEVMKSGFEKQLKVANARIEELQATLEKRSKAMPATLENAQAPQNEKVKTAEAPTPGFVKAVKTY